MKPKYPDIKRFLDKPFWLPTLDPHATYERAQDGAQDATSDNIRVSFGDKGEACIAVGKSEPIRFHNYISGGTSLRTQAALLILAEAMRLDNVDRPQVKPSARPAATSTPRKGTIPPIK